MTLGRVKVTVRADYDSVVISSQPLLITSQHISGFDSLQEIYTQSTGAQHTPPARVLRPGTSNALIRS